MGGLPADVEVHGGHHQRQDRADRLGVSRRPRSTLLDDTGTALISSIAGLLVFLAMLLFAVQVLIGLYTRSVVTDAAHEGARLVAGARAAQSEPAAREPLGSERNERSDASWGDSATTCASTGRPAPPTRSRYGSEPAHPDSCGTHCAGRARRSSIEP